MTSSQAHIHINAAKKITLKAGQSSITLDGANITFACPGTFKVKAGKHAFRGAGSKAARLSPLPSGRVGIAQEESFPAPTLTNSKDKKIIELYWSYGDSHEKLHSISRHYVDMNLHIVTVNYSSGESVSAEIKYEDEVDLINGQKTLKVTGIVDERGIVTITKPLSGRTLNLKA